MKIPAMAEVEHAESDSVYITRIGTIARYEHISQGMWCIYLEHMSQTQFSEIILRTVTKATAEISNGKQNRDTV